MKFKIGDRVRIVKVKKLTSMDRAWLGKVVTINTILTRDSYGAVDEDGSLRVYEEELEPYINGLETMMRIAFGVDL